MLDVVRSDYPIVKVSIGATGTLNENYTKKSEVKHLINFFN